MKETLSAIGPKISELKDVQYTLPDIANSSRPGTFKLENYEASYNGIPIEIMVRNHSFFDSEDKNLSADMDISIFAKREKHILVKIEICIEPEGNMYVGTTSVKNFESSTIEEDKIEEDKKDPEKRMKGIGRMLWEASIPIMQKFANKLDTQVVHKVLKSPSLGLEKKIGKWEELFLPILRKYGYAETRPNHWEKVYSPQ